MSSDLFRYSPPPPADESDESTYISDEEDDESDDMFDAMQKRNVEHTEMKEQMYQDKLADLKRQLNRLNEGNLPEWTKKLRRLDSMYRERLRFNEIIRDLEIEMVEKEVDRERKSALREFEEQKVYLKDQLVAELEEKLKMIETERHNMELTGDSMELKPITTRKLRRRANEPSGKIFLIQSLGFESHSFHENIYQSFPHSLTQPMKVRYKQILLLNIISVANILQIHDFKDILARDCTLQCLAF